MNSLIYCNETTDTFFFSLMNEKFNYFSFSFKREQQQASGSFKLKLDLIKLNDAAVSYLK